MRTLLWLLPLLAAGFALAMPTAAAHVVVPDPSVCPPGTPMGVTVFQPPSIAHPVGHGVVRAGSNCVYW